MNTYKTTSDGLIIHEMPVVGLAVSAAEHEYKMSEWVAENATLKQQLSLKSTDRLVSDQAIDSLEQENATLRAERDATRARIDAADVGYKYEPTPERVARILLWLKDQQEFKRRREKWYWKNVHGLQGAHAVVKIENNALRKNNERLTAERDQLKARVEELEKRTLRTVDHPEAKGRAPKYGDQAWTLSFPLEDGSVLKLEMGKESYDKFSQFLLDEMANAPDYEEGEGIANEVVCLRTQLAAANAQNAELRAALPFPGIAAGTADSLAFPLEQKGTFGAVTPEAAAAWLRKLARELRALSLVHEAALAQAGGRVGV